MKGFFFRQRGQRPLSPLLPSFHPRFSHLPPPQGIGWRDAGSTHEGGFYIYFLTWCGVSKRERERDWRSYLFPLLLLLLPFSPRFRVVSCQLRMSPLKGEWLMKSPTEGRRAWGKTRKRKKNNMPTTTLEFSSGRRGLEIRNKGRENWRVREEVLRHVFFRDELHTQRHKR